MRKSNLVVALGAAAALVAAPLLTATTASGAAGSNAGSAVTRDSGYSAAAADLGGCTQVDQPADYPANTKLVDLASVPDFTPVDEASKVKFAPTTEKRSVPGSWGIWGSPPDTETATPNVLWTAGSTSLTVTLPKKGRKTLGLEIEPNPFEVHTFTADFQKKNGDSICSLTVEANGDAGARVLGATGASAKIKKVVITGPVDFAIAQVRYKK